VNALRPPALLAAVSVAALQLAPGAQARPAVSQRLAVLRIDVTARAAPSTRAAPLGVVPARTPITGEATTLPVEAVKRAGGRRWLGVLLPGRPNGHRGWIEAASATNRWTPWRLVVDLRARRLSVFRAGRRVRMFAAVVGKPSTPTPAGSYFVEETVQLPAAAAGAPYALALSARSTVYQEFEGGPGQIAVHGVEHLGGTPGRAESHGCVRLATSSISWLAARIGPGVPVQISR